MSKYVVFSSRFPQKFILEHKYHHFVPVDMHEFSEVDYRKMLSLNNVARKDLQHIEQKILNEQNISNQPIRLLHIFI